jgi:hypothetical protein
MLGKVVEGMCGMNQCFGGDAATNQTCSAGSLTFDNDGFQTELSGSYGCDVSAGTCSDDEDLAIFGLHTITSHENCSGVL